MVCYLDFWGTLTRLTKSTHHPSIPGDSDVVPFWVVCSNPNKETGHNEKGTALDSPGKSLKLWVFGLDMGVSRNQGPEYRPTNSKICNYKDTHEKDP